MTLPLLPLLVVASLAAAGDPAFDAPHLTPVSWRVAPGGTVSVVLPPGAADEVDWLFLRAAGRQENRDAARTDGAGAVSFRAPAVDGGLVGLDRRPREVTLDRAAWPEFARRRAIPIEALPAGDGAVRVRLVESMKLLIRIAPEDASPVPSATAQSKSGQAVELRPLADPTTVPAGSVLPLKVYGTFRPGGLAVVARHLTNGAVVRTVTDDSGIARVERPEGGPWSIAVSDVRRLDARDDAALEIRSATLTFRAPIPADDAPPDGGKTGPPTSDASEGGDR